MNAMDNFAYALVSFIVALGLLIAIHEFGHYWVARKLGVKVLRFSIGFGRPLWQRRRGPDQTEYVIAMIPLGGYVKMLDEREEPVPPEELHRAFNRQPLGSRFAIVAAGPVFNFLFAILAYWLIFVLGVPGIKPLVGEVQPDSPFAQAGVRAGDQILAVDGEATPTLEAARMALIEAALNQRRVSLEVAAETGEKRRLELDLSEIHADSIGRQFLQELGFSPLRPQIPAVIDELQPGGAAEQAGLQPGDRVLSVDGEPVSDWMDWAAKVRARPGRPMELEVERNGARLQITVTPARVETRAGPIGRVGASPRIPRQALEALRATQQYSPLAALPAAMGKTWDMSVLTLQMLWKMLVGQASLENISGPLSIASYAGQSAQIGLVPFLSFLAIVSISLGVLNLLPIPVLDGGHLMYYVVEFFKGSPVSEQTQLLGQKIGIILLAGLMLLAFYNDIHRLFG